MPAKPPRPPTAFAVLWSQDRCRWLRKVGDAGPLEVVFGGPHTSMPSLARVRPGDTLYVLSVVRGELFVTAWMEVERIVAPAEFVRTRLGLEPHFGCGTPEERATWDAAGHRVPATCADQAAVGVRGSAIRFDRKVPPDVVAALTLGMTPGRETPLKGVVDGRLTSVLSLQGFVRRFSEASARLLAEAMAADPA